LLHGLWLHRDSVQHAVFVLYGLIAAVVGLGGVVVMLLLRQRQRVYPLQRMATQSMATAKSA